MTAIAASKAAARRRKSKAMRATMQAARQLFEA
jgi:hypothetical protein